MPNIYLKVTIEEKIWLSQNFDFLGLKNLSPGQFGELQLTKISLNFKTSWGLGAKLSVAFLLF